MGQASLFVLLLPVLVTYASGPSGCCSLNVTVVAGHAKAFPVSSSSSSDSGDSDGVEYSISIVESEYIVMFVSYYTAEARAGFLSAALRPYQHWTILPRLNAAADFPSDFSVVQLGGGNGGGEGGEQRGGGIVETEGAALRSLIQHPAVKQVTPQKKLTNVLTSGNSHGECVNCVWLCASTYPCLPLLIHVCLYLPRAVCTSTYP